MGVVDRSRLNHVVSSIGRMQDQLASAERTMGRAAIVLHEADCRLTRRRGAPLPYHRSGRSVVERTPRDDYVEPTTPQPVMGDDDRESGIRSDAGSEEGARRERQ